MHLCVCKQVHVHLWACSLCVYCMCFCCLYVFKCNWTFPHRLSRCPAVSHGITERADYTTNESKQKKTCQQLGLPAPPLDLLWPTTLFFHEASIMLNIVVCHSVFTECMCPQWSLYKTWKAAMLVTRPHSILFIYIYQEQNCCWSVFVMFAHIWIQGCCSTYNVWATITLQITEETSLLTRTVVKGVKIRI